MKEINLKDTYKYLGKTVLLKNGKSEKKVKIMVSGGPIHILSDNNSFVGIVEDGKLSVPGKLYEI